MTQINQESSFLEKSLRWVFSSPLITCLLTALVGAVSVYMLIREGKEVAWNKVTAGAVFGIFLGAVFSMDTKFQGPTLVGRLVNGGVGLLAGVAISFLLKFELLFMVFFGVGGFLLGATSRWWIDHINLP